MNIGVFGGTFDPFTLAHREVVKQVLEQKLVDVVYICPTIVTWHRANYTPWLDDNSKLNVIEDLLDDECFKNRIIIDDYDLKLRKLCAYAKDAALNEKYVNQHRFIDTLMRIKVNNEDDDFYVMIGPDEYKCFDKWYAYDSILNMCKGVIVSIDEAGNGRDGKPVGYNESCPALCSKTIALQISNDFLSISASKIREQFKSYENYVACAKEQLEEMSKKSILCHTPIFDVMKLPPVAAANGLAPVVVDAPDWVMIAVEKDGKWLVETQLRFGRMQQISEFPCGMVEKDETAKDAAIRELREETGIRILERSAIKYLGSTSPNPAFMTNKMTLFYVNLDEAQYVQEDQKLDAHEKLSWNFVDKNEFESSIMNEVARGYCGKTYVPAMLLSAMKLVEWRKSKGDI